MTVWLYNDSMANEWNDFVRASKNGTFLFAGISWIIMPTVIRMLRWCLWTKK